MKKAGRVSTKQQVTAVSLECDQEWLLSWRTVLNTMFVEQTPKGLHPTAQGCRTRLPWVSGAVRTSCHFQPRRGCGLDTPCFVVLAKERCNPFGVGTDCCSHVPKVAEYGNPWAVGRNPIGIWPASQLPQFRENMQSIAPTALQTNTTRSDR